MKGTIHWSILMAVLGFILGLGFLVPISINETREPASTGSDPEVLPFINPNLPAGDAPSRLADEPDSQAASSFSSYSVESVDRRENVLLDIHTVARSRYAKDTDAYVVTWFRPGARKEIIFFSYCDNYDYSTNRARTELNRFATAADSPQERFRCSTLSLEALRRGSNIITTIFGPVLSLKIKDFDPSTGGTLSVVFAYHISKVGLGNDYRAVDLKLTLKNGNVTITGPEGEYFDWLNLTMSEDVLGFPSGVNFFEFFSKGSSVAKYKGQTFERIRKNR